MIAESNVDVFNAWAKFVDYDEDRVQFNFGSLEHVGIRSAESIKLINEWDPTGDLGVVYIKAKYDDWLDNTSMKCSELVIPSKLEDWRKYVDMHQLLKSASSVVINRFREIIASAVNKSFMNEKLIGNANVDENSILNALLAISKDISQISPKVKLTVYQSSGEPLGTLESINSKIAVFDNIAECLATLEAADDGCYLCYVKTQISADGWFGYFIKDRGNLISIDDRIDEVYPGQHHNTRNGRYLEEKAYGWFPYDDGLFDFSEFDYKGYARKFEVNEDKLDVTLASEDLFVKMVVAMWLISSKYAGKTFGKPQEVIVNAFRCDSLSKFISDESAIVKIGDSGLAKANTDWTSPITVDQIVTGNTEFAPAINYVRDDDDLVKYHGAGFRIDKDSLSKLTLDVFRNQSISDEAIDIIATPEKIASMEYYRGRKELATYVRSEIIRKFKEFGGIEAMHTWYSAVINDNIEFLEEICAEAYADRNVNDDGESIGQFQRFGWNVKFRVKDAYYIDFVTPSMETCTTKRDNSVIRVFDRFYDNYDHRVIAKDRVNGNSCNVWFKLKPTSWSVIEESFNAEVPECLKGWRNSRVYDEKHYAGNPLLDMVDAVANMSHPMDSRDTSYSSKTDDVDCRMNFDISVGMSKRRVKSMITKLRSNEKIEDDHA